MSSAVQHRFTGASSRTGASTKENHSAVTVERGEWGPCVDCGQLCVEPSDGRHAPLWRTVDGAECIVNCVGRVLGRTEAEAFPLNQPSAV
jgi:hypothetical protein